MKINENKIIEFKAKLQQEKIIDKMNNKNKLEFTNNLKEKIEFWTSNNFLRGEALSYNGKYNFLFDIAPNSNAFSLMIKIGNAQYTTEEWSIIRYKRQTMLPQFDNIPLKIEKVKYN